MNSVIAKRIPLAKKEILSILSGCLLSNKTGNPKNGSMVHFEYERIAGRKVTQLQANESMVASELGLAKNRYTGRLVNVRIAKNGDTIVVMYVELEREGKYRSFNLDKGSVYTLKVME